MDKSKYLQKFLKQYAKKLGVGITEAEAEVVRLLYRVAKAAAPTFRFPPHSTEDMIHQGVIFGLEVLNKGKYDFALPLENFLYSHIYRRLYNFKRDRWGRPEAPCKCCDESTHCDLRCDRYRAWVDRNTSRRNIASGIEYDFVDDEAENRMRSHPDIQGNSAYRDIIAKIDAELELEYRSPYLRMRDAEGKGLSRKVKDAVRYRLAAILDRWDLYDGTLTKKV